jgi:hypothetical protein
MPEASSIRLGLGGQVAEDADGVEAVQLGHPDHVDAGLLVVGGGGGGLPGRPSS